MAERPDGKNYGSRVLRSAMNDLGGSGLDIATASEAIRNAVECLKEQTAALRGADFSKLDPKNLAQTIAYTAKMLDEVTRLLEFSQGRADSRSDIGLSSGLSSFLEVLTDEQFEQVAKWVEDGEQRLLKPQDPVAALPGPSRRNA